MREDLGVPRSFPLLGSDPMRGKTNKSSLSGAVQCLEACAVLTLNCLPNRLSKDSSYQFAQSHQVGRVA
jgi:hypothetical protein